jgi:hypothetical protein
MAIDGKMQGPETREERKNRSPYVCRPMMKRRLNSARSSAILRILSDGIDFTYPDGSDSRPVALRTTPPVNTQRPYAARLPGRYRCAGGAAVWPSGRHAGIQYVVNPHFQPGVRPPIVPSDG